MTEPVKNIKCYSCLDGPNPCPMADQCRMDEPITSAELFFSAVGAVVFAVAFTIFLIWCTK